MIRATSVCRRYQTILNMSLFVLNIHQPVGSTFVIIQHGIICEGAVVANQILASTYSWLIAL